LKMSDRRQLVRGAVKHVEAPKAPAEEVNFSSALEASMIAHH
jgi:hypothetical protein